VAHFYRVASLLLQEIVITYNDRQVFGVDAESAGAWSVRCKMDGCDVCEYGAGLLLQEVDVYMAVCYLTRGADLVVVFIQGIFWTVIQRTDCLREEAEESY